jgi:hypothetical protein
MIGADQGLRSIIDGGTRRRFVGGGPMAGPFAVASWLAVIDDVVTKPTTW